MKALLDCDGIFADFVSRACDLVNEMNAQIIIEPSQVTHYDLEDFFSTEEWQFVCMNIRPWQLAWYRGSASFLVWASRNLDCQILTRPFEECPTWKEERLAWLDPFIPRSRVVFTGNKMLHEGDCLVEDNLEILQHWVGYNEKPGFIFDRPWNRTMRQYPHITRVYNYSQLRRELEALKCSML